MDRFMQTVSFLFLAFLSFAAIDIISPCFGNSDVMCMESEKQALLTFKKDLKDLSNRLSSWVVADNDCCRWVGVVCNNSTGHVRELHLRGPDRDYESQTSDADYQKLLLGGIINPSLLNLKHLNSLDLSHNDFEGLPIPNFIGSLVSLQYLNLSVAGFNGTIPNQLGNISSLRSLDLSGSLYYSYMLNVENLQWLSGLSSLEHLDLSYVNLKREPNWLQVINMLPFLVELHLSYCHLDVIPPLLNVNFTPLAVLDLSRNGFKGPIPSGLQNLTGLRHLDLSGCGFFYYKEPGCGFNSTIPNWLYGFSRLETLDLSDNQLYGKISSAIDNMTSITTLDLSSNDLEGKVPRQMGNLCNLRILNLFGNKFEGEVSELFATFSRCSIYSIQNVDFRLNRLYGPLPQELPKFKILSRLYIGYNPISSPIPESIGRLSSLEELDLSGSQLNGTLPESLGQLSKLVVLDISNNSLEGVVSEAHFANLVGLRILIASGNHLALNVSPTWIPPFQLGAIRLTSWNLGPRFPVWLQSQKGIVALDLSSTGISDKIPTWFWDFSSSIVYLNLSHNQIYGQIPNITNINMDDPIIYLGSNQFSGPIPHVSPYVKELDLSNNSFSGDLSHFLCETKENLNRLTILHLGQNRLSGEIPDCWMNWKSLEVIKLGDNNLKGTIPSSMGLLQRLKSLHLRNNSLSGELPLSLKNCTELVLFDLGANEFFGSIPKWIGKSFSKLMVLGLRSNRFLGNIPLELCNLTSLQILDMANNRLSGKIPGCFSKFKAMTIKQSSDEIISYSYYEGTFLENAFVVAKGRENQYNTILKLVTSMDLSNNNISGEIPEEITDLFGLQWLNLSGNHLTGMIPKNIGDMGLLESLDFSRNQLSGEIPPSMSKLNFLSYLNLSYNNLVGKIPSSTQLQSLDTYSFIGNRLCGPPLSENCSTVAVITNNGSEGDNDQGSKSEVYWFYLTIALGFVVGFWVVWGPLLFNKQWRFAYFQFLENMWIKLLVLMRKCF